MRSIVTLGLGLAAVLATLGPARALDLNSFRAQHGRTALSVSATLSGIATSHARDLANRKQLDHANFRRRLDFVASAAAENVLVGCADEDCAIRKWAASGGHRANMLRRDVTHYGLASATADNGRRYWVLELGN